MLSYRKIVLLFLVGSSILIAVGWLSGFMYIWLVLLLILANVLLLLAGSFCICCGLYIQSLCSGNKSAKNIALSFDDGPHPEYTPRVLALLKEHEIKACFFLIGKNIEGNESIVKQIIEDGHSIGSHSYSHVNHFGFFSTKKLLGDLQKNEQILENISGKKVKLFRPPFGVTNPNIASAARFLDYTVIGWSIRSFDTRVTDPIKTIKRISKRLKAGKLILLHDNHERIIPILEGVIKEADSKGYSIVSVETLLGLK
jgi:peptidoglycan/xylan/chitin deacetylase (PgdA/CDA1 family)